MPTQSHTPMKYRERFSPEWSPTTGLYPTSSERNVQTPSFTSIQWVVTPKNPFFIASAIHPSLVVDTFPGANSYKVSSSFRVTESESVPQRKIITYQYVFFNHSTNLLWMYVLTSCALGISFFVVAGLIATSVLWYIASLGSLRDYRVLAHDRIYP